MFFDIFHKFPKLLSLQAANETKPAGENTPAEEEVEVIPDPLEVLREKCRETEHAKNLAEKYQACNERVLSKKRTAETCVEELFDLLHAVDHCVKKDLFNVLK